MFRPKVDTPEQIAQLLQISCLDYDLFQAQKVDLDKLPDIEKEISKVRDDF